MAKYSLRQQLWILTDWSTHGMRRAEYLKDNNHYSSAHIDAQLDSGEIIAVSTADVYVTQTGANKAIQRRLAGEQSRIKHERGRSEAVVDKYDRNRASCQKSFHRGLENLHTGLMIAHEQIARYDAILARLAAMETSP